VVTPGLEHGAPIGEHTTVFARTEFPYTGRSHGYFDRSGLPNPFLPGYGIVNLNVGITRDKLSAGLYAKNLINWKNVVQTHVCLHSL
jgi:outer membrane receptor protein involved in Fe transport